MNSNCTNFNYDKSKMLGDDYRLFYDTPIWDLAQAFKSDDLKTARRLVNLNIDINYKEPKFGQTVLFLTIRNKQFDATSLLLESGADPNVHLTIDDKTPLILAAEIVEIPIAYEFLKLLLKHGANPNGVQSDSAQKGKPPINTTPLIASCQIGFDRTAPLTKVKILVEGGADINYVGNYNTSALTAAFYQRNYDVVLYLLQHGADYKQRFMEKNKFDVNKPTYILDMLRQQIFDFESEEYKLKLKIILFLKEKGVDYWKHPVHPRIVEEIKRKYPDTWEEFLQKY